MFEFISPAWVGQLWKQLCIIREERNNAIQEISDTFGDPYSLAQFYVEPYCQNDNPANADENEPQRYVTSPIFTALDKFFQGEFNKKDDGRHQMFILSDAGMGKSSLLVMLALIHLTKFWPQQYGCKLVKLSPTADAQIKEIRNKAETVLLLDALDEDPSGWGNIKERLVSLLHLTKPFRRVVISCRTQFFPSREATRVGQTERIEIAGFKCPLLYLSLFDRTQVRDYLEKRFPQDTHTASRAELIDRSEQIIEKMGSLSFRPLLLSHIDDLLESPDQEWNEYAVYRTLLDIWLAREERKINEGRKESTVTKNQLKRACSVIASRMQHSGRRELPEQALKGWLSDAIELKFLSQVDVGGRSLLNRNSQGEFRFSHYTMQEFLVAEALMTRGGFFGEREGTRVTQKMLDFMRGSRPKRPRAGEGDETLTNFDDVDFSGLDLSDLSFTQCAMNRARFVNSRCLRAKFDDVEMQNAVLDHTDFRESRFTNVNLDNAVALGSTFTDSYFIQVTMRCLDATQRALFVRCRWKSVDLSWSVFSNANFTGSSFARAVLVSCDFREANLSRTILDGADLTGAQLSETDLNGASLKHANLTKANFTLARNFNARQEGIVLQETVMPDGDLKSGNLRFREVPLNPGTIGSKRESEGWLDES
jgi:uncharacterized protein YjbI with pentapeptide repeats